METPEHRPALADLVASTEQLVSRVRELESALSIINDIQGGRQPGELLKELRNEHTVLRWLVIVETIVMVLVVVLR